MSVQIEADLRPFLMAVRDQGNRQTCLAHASTLAHEYNRGATSHFSPEYLHYFATKGVSGGCSILEMRRALKDNGQSSEADCPYQPADPPKGWSPPKSITV